MRNSDTEDKPYFRSSERLFRVNSAWYFAAREGDQGPFETEQRAEAELRRYIEEQVSLQSFTKSRVASVGVTDGDDSKTTAASVAGFPKNQGPKSTAPQTGTDATPDYPLLEMVV